MSALSQKEYDSTGTLAKKPNYSKLTKEADFQNLMKKKKSFILPATVFFLVFYFMLPILAAYTNILKADAFAGLTWAWVYALAQFIVVWVAGIVYIKKSAHYDSLAAAILTKNKGELDT
ncbi:hypothetical protein AC623_17655 [Bacillus sp. FJAT-27231]|uniref:DUF485 domain-containing protein n=1 Tax=Bacillus sp. FJAT-27231 TaxID=1679168 RepID=UPI000670941E|nr:DUF485 domain-containing protein [Bacillus sp. FJAT-27231]KMY55541.1 hypothetical protein AC623_17655 [Bacillus sp. FJAT-27231]